MKLSKEVTTQLTGLALSSANQPIPNTMIKIVTIKHGKTPSGFDDLVHTDHEGRYSFYLLPGVYEIFITYHKNWYSYGKLEVLESDINKVYSIQDLVYRYDMEHSDIPYWTKEKLFKYYALEFIFPVGSIYTSFENVSPADKLGGEWELLPSRYIRIADTLHPGGWLGGNSSQSFSANQSITLTEDNLPNHTHSFSITGSTNQATLKGTWYDLTFNGQRDGHPPTGIISYTGNTFGSGIDNSGGDLYEEIQVDASHNHTINISGEIGHTGNGQPINVSLEGTVNVTPEYITVYMWKRVK